MTHTAPLSMEWILTNMVSEEGYRMNGRLTVHRRTPVAKNQTKIVIAVGVLLVGVILLGNSFMTESSRLLSMMM